MTSIYFYYNELLHHSADQAIMHDKNTHGPGHEHIRQQQGDKSFEIMHQGCSNNPGQMTFNAIEKQDDDKVLKVPFQLHPDTEATLIALQPRMNRLFYLQTAVGTSLDVLVPISWTQTLATHRGLQTSKMRTQAL
ncbi:unnamed protein product [Peronospora farinosa]|uniref:Uncharacterized protein n=1 Tax=Peronospora farinosa TaxID=134698 RepID=A0AAV0TJ15_9STRA|nr:unnamed protein product [Peronospora farinosa]CAI5722790.1 unnamed protein product [Peronospora farinosa]